MIDETSLVPIPPDDGNKMAKADWFFVVGLALTFVMGVGCMIMNFIKPGSTPAEPIWALAGVVIGHKVSSDKFGT